MQSMENQVNYIKQPLDKCNFGFLRLYNVSKFNENRSIWMISCLNIFRYFWKFYSIFLLCFTYCSTVSLKHDLFKIRISKNINFFSFLRTLMVFPDYMCLLPFMLGTLMEHPLFLDLEYKEIGHRSFKHDALFDLNFLRFTDVMWS